jgi:hypothetical protein
MYKLLSGLIVSIIIAFSIPVHAQAKCEGPAELCTEIQQLRTDISARKSLEVKATAEAAAKEQQKEGRTQKMIAGAAILAVLLKTLLSGVKSWTGYFTTDKQKAALKLITVGVGLLAFIVTNIGYGIPWWQALILAGGGPASVAVHEFTAMVPVLNGKAKLPPSDPPPAGKQDVPTPS